MILIISSVVLFMLGIILCISLLEDALCGISITMSFTLSSVLLLIFYVNEPKAIDVYQGKTTLEITYRDGIPVDSVVIFKNK